MERWYGLLCDYLVKCEFMEPMMWSDHTSWSVILMMDQIDRTSLFQCRGRAPDKFTVKRRFRAMR